MRACIYNDDIDSYANIIKKNSEYEISNAFINSNNQMTLSSRTDIRQLETTAGSSQPASTNWSISSIPREPDSPQEYDIVVVVLYVGLMKTVTTASGYTTDVCELFVTDSSIEDSLIVSAWNDLAVNEYQQLRTHMNRTPVIGLTCLKASNYNGLFAYHHISLADATTSHLATPRFITLLLTLLTSFSLSTSRSTFIIVDPEGEASVNLRQWKAGHGEVLQALRDVVEGTQPTITSRDVTKIKDVLPRTRDNTQYDDLIRLRVYIPDFKKENVCVFVGFQNCGKKTMHELGLPFMCPSCNRKGATTASATDGSGTLILVAYTEHAQTILEVMAADLLQMGQQQIQDFYEKAAVKLRTTPICIDVAATKPRMPQMKVIKWALKAVIDV